MNTQKHCRPIETKQLTSDLKPETQKLPNPDVDKMMGRVYVIVHSFNYDWITKPKVFYRVQTWDAR